MRSSSAATPATPMSSNQVSWNSNTIVASRGKRGAQRSASAYTTSGVRPQWLSL